MHKHPKALQGQHKRLCAKANHAASLEMRHQCLKGNARKWLKWRTIALALDGKLSLCKRPWHSKI